MISQGTDGLSRGVVTEGVMAGKSMLSFVPLYLNALDRQPSLLDWLRDWLQLPGLTPLMPDEWFDRGHGYQNGGKNKRGIWLPTEMNESWLLWCPPPAAADVAVEELLLSRHKRTHINHVFMVQRLGVHQK
jgi:hypothetical protein